MGGGDRIPGCFGASSSGVLGSEEERKGICRGIVLRYPLKMGCSRSNKKLIGEGRRGRSQERKHELQSEQDGKYIDEVDESGAAQR